MKTIHSETCGDGIIYKLIYAAITLYLSFLMLNHAIWYMQQVFGQKETMGLTIFLYLTGIVITVGGLVMASLEKPGVIGNSTQRWAMELAERRRRIPRKEPLPASKEGNGRQRAPFPAICKVAANQQM